MKPAEVKLYLLYTYLKICSDDQNFIIAPNLCRIDFLSKQQMWTFQELRNLLPQNCYTGPIRKLYISPDSTSKVQNLTQCLLLIGQDGCNYAIRLCSWRTKMAGSALRASWEIFFVWMHTKISPLTKKTAVRNSTWRQTVRRVFRLNFNWKVLL